MGNLYFGLKVVLSDLGVLIVLKVQRVFPLESLNVLNKINANLPVQVFLALFFCLFVDDCSYHLHHADPHFCRLHRGSVLLEKRGHFSSMAS